MRPDERTFEEHIAGSLVEDDVAETGFFWLRAAQEVRPTARRQLGAFLAFASKNGRKASNLPADMASLRPGEAAEPILKLAGIVRPPVRSRQVAEYLDVPVYDWQFPDKISGVFVSHGGVFCIGVNEQHPHVRQRFTIAHELGHFVFSSDRDLFIDFAEADKPQEFCKSYGWGPAEEDDDEGVTVGPFVSFEDPNYD